MSDLVTTERIKMEYWDDSDGDCDNSQTVHVDTDCTAADEVALTAHIDGEAILTLYASRAGAISLATQLLNAAAGGPS